jgi:1,4-dihydroxy-6-naphthoate synthase
LNSQEPKLIKVAHSPDSDDAFMFYALAEKKIDTKGLEFKIESAEIEKLNQVALREQLYDLTAISFHAYAYLSDKYQILRSGASMGGKNYGPRLISKKNDFDIPLWKAKQKLKIAVPGKLTSAYLCMQIYLQEYKQDFEPIFCHFDEVFDLLNVGAVDLSLLIHESQLSFQEQEFRLGLDLGRWWYEKHKDKFGKDLFMPLGCNAISRGLSLGLRSKVSALLKDSIRYALNNFDEALAYARDYSKHRLSDEAAKKYIEMYVNSSAVELSDNDLKSLEIMLNEARELGLVTNAPRIVIDPV